MFKETKTFSSFSISNLQQSKAFYGDTMGLKISEPMGQLAIHPAGIADIFLYEKSNHEPATFTVLNFLVSNLENAMEELRKRGVKFEIYKEDGFATDENGIREDQGMKIAWFKDPSGNILSLIEDNQ